MSARSFEHAARQAKARFIVGLSATVTRKDGHHPIIFMQCGPVRHRVDARTQAAARPFEHHVLVRPTTLQQLKTPDADKRLEFQGLYQSLIEDAARTCRICEDIVDAVRAGRSPLVLTERNEHVDRLAELLTPMVRHVVVLRAGVGKKQRDAINERLAAIPREEERVMIATGKYVGEGLETLPETKGRFFLNGRLPIAFDASSALEVDLLCAKARLAIELDGGQHLSDPDAYRRDRRKDQLLQENGYFVLRFLAEDVGKDLDRVLDTILRTLGRPRLIRAPAEG